MSTTSFTSPTHRPAFATLPHHHHIPQQLRRRRRPLGAAAAAERGCSSSSSSSKQQQQQQQEFCCFTLALSTPASCPYLFLASPPLQPHRRLAASCSCHHRRHLHRLKIAPCSSHNKTDSLFRSSRNPPEQTIMSSANAGHSALPDPPGDRVRRGPHSAAVPCCMPHNVTCADAVCAQRS